MPTIPHYRDNKTPGMMKSGHVFTIEPMINQGTWKDILWPDDWTAVKIHKFIILNNNNNNKLLIFI